MIALDFCNNMKRLGDIGIEIEMEGEGVAGDEFVDHVSNNWSPSHDGSLRGECIELGLYSPIYLREVHRFMSNLEDDIAEFGVEQEETGRSGIHLHLNVQQLNYEEVYITLLILYLNEGRLLAGCSQDRQDNYFCLPINKLQGEHESLQMALSYVTNGQGKRAFECLSAGDKYAAINRSSIRKFGSIEFRALESPCSAQKVSDYATGLHWARETAVSLGGLAKLSARVEEEGIEFLMIPECIVPHGLENMHCAQTEKLIKPLLGKCYAYSNATIQTYLEERILISEVFGYEVWDDPLFSEDSVEALYRAELGTIRNGI